MKKLILFIMILLFPMLVNAEENNLVLKSITLEKLSEDVEELSPATIEDNKINLDLKMYEVGDTAEYKVTIQNPTDKDLYLEQNIVNTESTYFDYELLGVDKSTVIEKNSEKEFLLKVKYQNEVEKENFFSAKFKDTSSLSFLFSNSSNPETKRNILLILIVSLCIFVAFKYNRKSKVLFLLLLLGIIPHTTIAENDYHVGITLNILIKKVKPNPCTFDGELTQGAEYTNGQYTYRYMQESNGTSWGNIETDGWGVKLTDTSSEEDVTTKLCTSINDKPIVSMRLMFYNSKASNIDLSSFDTSKVINMNQMFVVVNNGLEYDFSSFDTSNVTNMSYMFTNNFNLKNVDLHYFNTSKVTNMTGMFSSTALEAVNLDGWDLTGSTNGSSIISNMFSSANNLKKVSMKNWKLPPTFINSLGCRVSALCSENMESIDVTGWDLSNNTDIRGTFGDYKGNGIIGLETWDTSNATNMYNMFYAAKKLQSLDLSNWDTSKVTSMGAMFYNASSLKKLNLSSFDTSKVTNMSAMFFGATALESLDLSGFDTSNVTDMGFMLAGVPFEVLDLKNFNTSKVSSMQCMFAYSTDLKKIIVGDNFQTNQVSNSSGMFLNCPSLVGGNGTIFDANHIDKEYARIDMPNTPGYFTSTD